MKIDTQLKNDFKRYIQEQLTNYGAHPVVTIVAAYPLSASELELIKHKIPFVQNAKVLSETDPSLLAGIVIKYGSTMIDLSLKTELQKLQQTLYDTA